MSDDEEKRSPELEVKDGGVPSRKELRNLLHGTFLDVHGDNFMGSGLGFSEWAKTMDILKYERWYGNQAREEKKRRMQFLLQLCAEQERLVSTDISATGLSENLIENRIEGDWNGVKCWIDGLKFDEERGEYRSLMAKRFEKFVAIAQEAYDSRPKVFCPGCRKPAPKQNIGSWPDGRHECPWCEIVHDNEGNWAQKDKANIRAVKDESDECSVAHRDRARPSVPGVRGCDCHA